MSWKARDWTGCFVAALAAAVAGAVVGRMIGFDLWGLGQGWMRLGSLDFKQEPYWYYGVVSFLPLLVLCVILRLTLFKEFVGSRRQRAVMFPMMLGPALALGITAALVVAALALGYPELPEVWVDGWSATIRSAARGQLYDDNREITFIVVTTFVQGAVLGVVFGGWFVASPRASSNRRPRDLILPTSGILVILFCAASVLVESLKKGRDRAACILNCRNVQIAIRSYSGMNGINPGDFMPEFQPAELFGPPAPWTLDRPPVCPAGGHYTWVDRRIPLVGELMIRCSCPEHQIPAEAVADW